MRSTAWRLTLQSGAWSSHTRKDLDKPTRQGGGWWTQLLPLTLLSSSVCVSFRVSTGSVCLCAHSDRPRQQTLRHRLDHSQAGRRAGGRQAECSKAERLAEERQAREWVNQQRMSEGAVQNRAPEWEREREKTRAREEECVSDCTRAPACACLCVWMCCSVSPPQALFERLSRAVPSCAETGWVVSLLIPQPLDRLSAAGKCCSLGGSSNSCGGGGGKEGRRRREL